MTHDIYTLKYRWVAKIVGPWCLLWFLFACYELNYFVHHQELYPLHSEGPAAGLWNYQTADRYFWSVIVLGFECFCFAVWSAILHVRHQSQIALGVTYSGLWIGNIILHSVTGMTVYDVVTAAILFATGES